MSGIATSADVQKKASYLELFFDLVFVFAITQLAAMLHDDHSAAGWAHAGLMAWLVWWAWSQYTWAGNAIDLDQRTVRIAILGVTGVVLIAGMAIPTAFADGGAWFALPYVVVRLAGLGLYWWGLRDEPAHQRALRSYLPVAAVAPVLVLIGGTVDASIRPWWWLAAALVDAASALAAGRGEFRVAPEHFAERHALIVIIALGESVIAIGLTGSSATLDAALALTAAAAFVIVASFWWAYFDWVQGAALRRLEGEADHRRRGHAARDLYTFAHLPIVTGAVVFAVGVEEAVLHPDDPLPTFGRVAVATGLGLFLSGFVLGNLRATGRVLVERVVAAVVVIALVAIAGSHWDAGVLIGALAAVSLATLAVEHLRPRGA